MPTCSEVLERLAVSQAHVPLFFITLKQGAEDIKSGRRKVAVVGSSEAPIIPEVIDGYSAMSALATDADLRKLDGVAEPNYRRASRPFGQNCGFTLAESSQYVVLMSDDLAIELGAEVYGAVPGVYVNADGYKKSISAPGAGNYITMGKALGLASSLLGEDVVRQSSFVQAHGSSTPQNRVTESKIFHEVAKAFSINDWPVAAIKSYVGHSLGPASGDQLANTIGVFAHGILPGVKTIDSVAADVYADRLNIQNVDQELGKDGAKIAFLNSKGFGGNNATAAIFSPDIVKSYLEKQYSSKQILGYQDKRQGTLEMINDYVEKANEGELRTIYDFGTNLIDDDEQIEMSTESIKLPGFENTISLKDNEGFEKF